MNWGAKVIRLTLYHNKEMIPSFNPEALSGFAGFIKTPKKIVITTHYKPDGDALGSSLGFKLVLESLGHQVKVVSPSEFPSFLSWMKGSKEVIDFIRNPVQAKQAFAEAELVCCLDFNDPKRVEGMADVLMLSPAPKMLLDHHLDPKPFCDFMFSDSGIASTCELVYHLVNALGITDLLNQDAGECLYAGIMTDTGSFRFRSVTPDTHRVVAALMEKGVRNDFVHEKIYDTFSESRLRFLGNSLLNHMVVLKEFNTVYFIASKEDMEKFKHESGDLEGIVNYGLSILGIKMAVLFSERDKMVKISFRSKGDFSVQSFAEKNFEGGGHKNASGGKSYLSLKDTLSKFVALLPEYKDQLSS
ncbi:bifunctional oligoribonuclease/PAP phosphatase NrnA [soil metagenome]